MIAPCFVDANVFVYACDPVAPLKQQVALALLGRLWREQSGRTSVEALNEFYVVATRKLPKPLDSERAWREVDELLQWNPQPTDSGLITAARQIEIRHRLSWWDAQIVAAAKAQHCATLYTEDLQHGAIIDGVRVCNPFIAQVQKPAPPAYVPVRVAGHRPRGRPRKSAA
ncbi:MAG: PIN domain-containing protein [Proteobacteria bacterium]|nr:PIN domain-containing protein [Pseudomonadota bacterium]